MGSGFLLNGKAEQAEGLIVQNLLDNPRLKLAPDDERPRSAGERRWVRAIVLHTTGGIPGSETDLRQQTVLPGYGASSRGGERVVASWTHDHDRAGGAHLIIDFDGRVYCCADLLLTAAYHAGPANGASVGIEIVQGHDGHLYEGQLDVAVLVVDWLTARLGIQRQFQALYRDRPVPRLVGQLRCTGIFGHRDLVYNRWRGDPGNAVFEKLRAAGYEAYDFEVGQDLQAWKQRQGMMGLDVDGLPGPQTRDALLAAGYVDGMWVRRP